MAGSAINLGISGGMFSGSAPQAGANAQALAAKQTESGAALLESSRRVGEAPIDYSDPASMRTAAAESQKRGDLVEAQDLLGKANKQEAFLTGRAQADRQEVEQGKTDATSGAVEEQRQGMLGDAAFEANHPTIFANLESGIIDVVAAQKAIAAKEAKSIVTKQREADATKLAQETASLQAFSNEYLALTGDKDMADSLKHMTVGQAANHMAHARDQDPNSAKNVEKEMVAHKSEVDALGGSIRGMLPAEAKLAMETISNNQHFWPIDPVSGKPVRGKPDYSRVSSEYMKAFNTQIRNQSIAKLANVKPTWKNATKASVTAAEGLVASMRDVMRPPASWYDTDNYGGYDGETEWITLVSEAIPTVQAGMDVPQIKAEAIVQQLITNGFANAKDIPFGMSDLLDIIDVMVAQDRAAKSGTALPRSATATTAPAATSEAEAGADAAMAGVK